MDNIFDTLKKNKFSYSEIREKSHVALLSNEAQCDVNVIIGFRGRHEFFVPLIESFKKAFAFYNNTKKAEEMKKFHLTFVEHNDCPKAYEELCKHAVNYIFTPGNVTEQYSRSFAYNFGAKYSNKSKYYLLHDLDILVKENFFEEIFENLKNSPCMQTYGKRRVLYLSQELTPDIINNKIDYNTLDENSAGVSLPMYAGLPAYGSKGGSILVEHDLFYEIGGFDPELFWGYAAEDQIFWDKAITLLGEITYADNPPIDMFHMWHPPSNNSNPMLNTMESYMLQFRNMKKKDRIAFLNIKKEFFKDGE